MKILLLLSLMNLCFTHMKDKTEDGEFLFRININGGFMGLNEEILIKKDGVGIFVNKKENKEWRLKIPLKELKEFEAHFLRLSKKKIGTPYPDCLFYKIESPRKSVIIIPPPHEVKEPFSKLLILINRWKSLTLQEDNRGE